MDLADSRLYDVVLPDALAMFNHLSDDPQGDAELEMDGGIYSAPNPNRYGRLLYGSGRCAPYGTCLIRGCLKNQNTRLFLHILYPIPLPFPHFLHCSILTPLSLCSIS